MSRRRVVGVLSSVLVLLIAVLTFVQQSQTIGAERERVIDSTEEIVGDDMQDVDETDMTNAQVLDVADGDTFTAQLDTGEEVRVRLLGVDTPETVDPRKPVQCFGREASEFTKGVLARARVTLEADPRADERDVYGRLLRNVITADGTDFNAQLVEEGYARAFLSFPLDPVRKKQLTDLEAAARAEGRGLWGDLCHDV